MSSLLFPARVETSLSRRDRGRRSRVRQVRRPRPRRMIHFQNGPPLHRGIRMPAAFSSTSTKRILLPMKVSRHSFQPFVHIPPAFRETFFSSRCRLLSTCNCRLLYRHGCRPTLVIFSNIIRCLETRNGSVRCFCQIF